MANKEHLEILLNGVIGWNEWRKNNPEVTPDLRNANLREANLSIEYPERDEKDEVESTRRIYLVGADLSEADLGRADLSRAHVRYADFADANLEAANLRESWLMNTDFSGAGLHNANFDGAHLGWNVFGNLDLSTTSGLDHVFHTGPSIVGIDTLYRSAGAISEAFLHGCGVPDEFITYIPSLIGAQQAVQFYSCFISYSHKDEEFAKRLHSRLRSEHIRVWFAPEDIQGGKKLYEQIDQAIQMYDRLLLVISETSMHSDWVISEIRRARKVEIKEKRQKLFPIRLVDFEAILKWECFDADSGKDLAGEVREYFIPDFSNWRNHDVFEVAVVRLLNDLRGR